jgi:heat shock protein HslJ
MKTSILTAIVLLFTLISCKNEELTNANLLATWEAKNFMSLESIAYPKNENNKILLTFDENGSYHLKLDINNCGGNFTSGENNMLEIESTACTEACCDSKFSEKLVMMISKVTSFNIEGNTLKLNVPQWGYIELEVAE